MSDERWMGAALALARRGLGRTAPNPSVGCVIVRDGMVLGRGRTGDGGRPHAERAALGQAGAAAAGAAAYVTLEPCAHHGQTPPCADALIDAGITRVVVAQADPDPRVAGRGLKRLEAAGIAVHVGAGAAAAAEINEGFFSRIRRGRPMLTLKMAATLDGRIATASGESRWITGPAARKRVHAMRAAHDAVMVGIGTVLADDPMLDVRLPGVAAQPSSVVVDSGLRTPPGGRLMRGAAERPVLIACAEAAARERREALIEGGATVFSVRATPGGGLDPAALLHALGDQGLTRVFCEGGGRLAASLLRAGLVDRLIWMGAGAIIGSEGIAAVGPLGIEALAGAPRFALAGQETADGDIISIWRPCVQDAGSRPIR